MRIRVLALALAAAFIAACGASGSQQLVEAAARWDCDRQRFAFESLADIETARNETLAALDVSQEAFAEFEAKLETDADLRNAVFVAYEAYCGTPEGDGRVAEG